MASENFGIGHSNGTIDLYTMVFKTSSPASTPTKCAEVKLWTSETKEDLQALVYALQNYLDEKFAS